MGNDYLHKKLLFTKEPGAQQELALTARGNPGLKFCKVLFVVIFYGKSVNVLGH
jgi:hypothetical protein